LGKAVGKEMLHPWELMVKAGKVTMSPIDSTKRAGKAIAEFGSTLAEDTKSAWKNSPAAGRGGAALAMAVRTVTGAQALKASQIGQKLGKAIDKTKVGQVSKSATVGTIKDIPQISNTPSKVVTNTSKTPSTLNKATTAAINTANLSRLTNGGSENIPNGSDKLLPITMKAEQTRKFPDKMWTTVLNSWEETEKLSAEQVALLKSEPVSTFAIKSENGSDVSFYFPEKYQEQMEALKGSISAVETELQEYVRSHFPEYTDAVRSPDKNSAKIIFAEGLGKEAHKTRQDLVLMDTQELSSDKQGELMEKYIHERTHQILHYDLSESVGSTQHMGLMEGIANVMPEIMYNRMGGQKLFKPTDSLDHHSHVQSIRSESGVGDEMIQAENGDTPLAEQFERAIDEREKVDKTGSWNYEYGQAFVKSFMTMHGEEKMFDLYREVGTGEQYRGMGAIKAIKNAMRGKGYAWQEIHNTMETTANTVKLRGLQNKRLHHDLLDIPRDKMDRVLEGQDIRIVLNIPHGRTEAEIIKTIGRIEKKLISETSFMSEKKIENLKYYIGKLNKLAQ